MNNTKHSNVQSVFRLGEQWTPCFRWEDLPSGKWLVKIDNPSYPYQVVMADAAHIGFNEISIVKNNISSSILTLHPIQAYRVIPEYRHDMYNQYTNNEEMFDYEKDILPWEDGTLGESLEHAEVSMYVDEMNTLTKIRIEGYIQKMEKNLEEFRRFVEEIKTTSEEISK